ncbi:hypothetical protein ACLOJK_011631 [Asimina triloba]
MVSGKWQVVSNPQPQAHSHSSRRNGTESKPSKQRKSRRQLVGRKEGEMGGRNREVCESCVESLIIEMVSAYSNRFYSSKPEMAARRIEAIGFQVGHQLSERYFSLNPHLPPYHNILPAYCCLDLSIYKFRWRFWNIFGLCALSFSFLRSTSRSIQDDGLTGLEINKRFDRNRGIGIIPGFWNFNPGRKKKKKIDTTTIHPHTRSWHYRRFKIEYTMERPRFSDHLEAIKFICKDFWSELFKKQIDNLKTNHRGTFVLQDNRFRWLTRVSIDPSSVTDASQDDSASSADDNKAAHATSMHLYFPCGIIRGALTNLGIPCAVSADMSNLPACEFQALIVHRAFLMHLSNVQLDDLISLFIQDIHVNDQDT